MNSEAVVYIPKINAGTVSLSFIAAVAAWLTHIISMVRSMMHMTLDVRCSGNVWNVRS